jgi:serine-type D-Ala-D-Ala carboxypeptidase
LGAPDKAQLDSALSRLLEAGVSGQVFPGATACVGYRVGGEAAFAEGVAGQLGLDRSLGLARKDTLYDLASLTKPVVAMTALVAEARKLVDLDRPAESVIGDLRGGPSADVTVRHLLSHSAGLSAWGGLFLDVPHAPGSAAARRWVIAEAGRRRERPNGAAVEYSDLGYIIAGAMLAVMSGRPLDRLVADLVTVPLGIQNEVFFPGGATSPGRATYAKRVAPTERCEFRGRIVRGEVHDENASVLGGVAGHAGLFGTALGVARFGRAVMDVIGGYSDVFPRASLLASLEPRSGTTYRMGWDGKSAQGSTAGERMDESAFGHLGFTGTSLWCDPARNLVVVLLSNRVHPSRANRRINGFRPAFHDGVLSVYDNGLSQTASSAG